MARCVNHMEELNYALQKYGRMQMRKPKNSYYTSLITTLTKKKFQMSGK